MLVLVSRTASDQAGNANSSSPSLVYIPNSAFVQGTSDPDTVPVGTVRIAFASDATEPDRWWGRTP